MAGKETPRKKGIPEEFPLKLYYPQLEIRTKPEIVVGIDTGVNNTCFCSLEIERDEHFNMDYKYKGGIYYFKDELKKYKYQIDRQYQLLKNYYDLFSDKNVKRVVYELMPIDKIKDENTLSGIIQTQATTNYINMLCFSLAHYTTPIPAPSVKHCLTGRGNASKGQMCQAAYQLTKDAFVLDNDHMADAFGMAFYGFISMLKEECKYHNKPIPDKFKQLCPWNFK